MEATFSCPQCSFCVDHDIMLRVLKHFFNCTSFQYIMDLSCGHHPGLGHTHFPGTLKYKHVSDSPVSNKNATPQACTSQREPAAEENMAENEFHDSSAMIPPAEIKTEPAEDTMDGPDCTVVEPTAPPAQMMDTAGFGEDCHPVSVVCAMGGMQDAVAGSSNDTDGLLQHDTETHTITTEPVGAPSMVVTRSPAMAAARTPSAGSHGNNDGGTLDLPLQLICSSQPSHAPGHASQEEFAEKSQTPEEVGEECSDEEDSMPSNGKDVKAHRYRRRKQLCAHNYPVKWAANAYKVWAEQENGKLLAKEPCERFLAPTDWTRVTPQEANFWVSKYLTEVRKQDGKPYTPSTLHTLAHGLDHHIKEDLGINHLELMSSNPQFADVRNALLNQKQLYGHLEGISKSGVKEFTEEDEVELWRKVFDLNTSQGLLYAVYYHNCKLFGVWTGEEHHSLTVSQFSFGQDNKGQFVKFIRQGRKKKAQGKEYTYYAVPGNPWCVVSLYQLYLSKIPPKGPFYFRPVTNPSHSHLWYSAQPVGHNYFATIMSKLADMIGLDGRYTAASVCKERPLRGDLPCSKRLCSHEHLPIPTVHGTTCTLAPVNIAPKSSSVHSAAAASGSASFTDGAPNPSLFMLVPVASSMAGTGELAPAQATRGNDRDPYQS